MNRVVFQFEDGGDAAVFAETGENLLELARKAGVVIDAPCSGNGSCGKCRVQLMDGDIRSKKSLHLEDDAYREGWRLACSSSIIGDVKVMVPDIASAHKRRLKTADLSSPEEVRIFNELQENLQAAGFRQGGQIKSFSVTMDAPSLEDTMPDNERFTRAVREATGAKHVTLPIFLLKNLPDLLRDHGFALRCVGDVTGSDIEMLDAIRISGAPPVCGLAIDIGTTTVTGVLVNLATGVILSKASVGNGQIRYGADVINRIVEQQKPGGVEKLQKAIIEETLQPLIDALCTGARISRSNIFHMTIASNTTMNHLLLGINADYLRREPYVPAFFELGPVLASAAGIALATGAKISFAPNIGSYVGGDITAGTLASLIWNTPKLSMLIDLGTNGEIVFGNNEFLISCACSAGPAFEGGEISCGMRATHGAIEAVSVDKDSTEPKLTVIGNCKPVGICGSGIIDLIAELFRAGIINGKGKFIREGRRVIQDEYGIGRYVLAFAEESTGGRQVAVTEVDIDNFIRAKGAIFSAVMTLLSALGYSPMQIEHISVAGGIGSGINIQNAIRIGMFPDIPLERYTYIGNSALAGAYAALTSEDAANKLSELAKSMTYLELSTQPGYMDSFVAACFLPHSHAALFPSVSDVPVAEVVA